MLFCFRGFVGGCFDYGSGWLLVYVVSCVLVACLCGGLYCLCLLWLVVWVLFMRCLLLVTSGLLVFASGYCRSSVALVA